MPEERIWYVKERQAGMRLDRFLLAVFLQYSRVQIQARIARGGVAIDGAIVSRTDFRLKLGMVVRMVEPALATNSRHVEAAEIPEPRVINETEAFLVLSKPAGISMHPAGNSHQMTVSDWISTTYPQILGIGEDNKRPGMVHRLDKETSGLVLIAKTNRAFKALKKLFQERTIEKTYFALVYGNMPEPSGTISFPIGRIKGERKRAVPAGKREFGGELREAVTEYALHTRYTGYDFLSVKPKTGRTHQIRVHLSAMGHPIVGDRLYRFKEHRRNPLKPPFQLLHAGELRFHLGKRKYHFAAPLPDYFRNTLKMLDAEAGRGYDWSA